MAYTPIISFKKSGQQILIKQVLSARYLAGCWEEDSQAQSKTYSIACEKRHGHLPRQGLPKVMESSVSIRICENAGVQTSLLHLIGIPHSRFLVQVTRQRQNTGVHTFIHNPDPVRLSSMQNLAHYISLLWPHWKDYLFVEFSFILQKMYSVWLLSS